MPLLLTNIQFNTRYTFAQGTNNYRVNAGDEADVEMRILSAIRLTSIDNPLSFDPTTETVTSSSISWLDEGFRQGDFIRVELWEQSSNGTWSVINTHQETCSYVDDQDLNMNNLPFFYSLSGDPQIMIFTATQGTGFSYSRARYDLTISLNNPRNSQTNQIGSFIDGETSRFQFGGYEVHSLAIGQIALAQPIPNQSGGFFKNVRIMYQGVDDDKFRIYKLYATLVGSGIYDVSQFALDDCQKFLCKLEWSSELQDMNQRAELVIEEGANTGWFNEANNISIPQLPSQVLGGVTTEVDYATDSQHTFTFEGDITKAGFGACYIPTDDAYYRNVASSQYGLTMILPTTDLVVGLPQSSSSQNPDGADFSIQINSISSNGNTHVVTFTFQPNLNFPTFMENRDSGDRLFYIWVNAGNFNWLVYQDQLTKVLPIGGPISMVNDYGFFDHSENVENTNENKVGFICDTEDDVGYFGKFALERNGDYAGLKIKLQAHNSATDEDFELQETNISFNGVQTSNLGELLLNETIPLENTLPTTSVKREGKLINLNTTGSGQNEYLVSIYYPFLLNWKYWQPLLSASVDFYPTQNNNWEQYDNILNWQIRIRLELEKDGLIFFHNNTIAVNPYDANDDITSVITMIRDSDGTIVSVIPDGELLRIVATHTRIDGNDWDPNFTWGMITIEPKEAEQRFICSSIIDYDNNQANPLTPLSGLTINITYPSSNIARMECFLDSAKLDLINGVKITSKICEGCTQLPQFDEVKLTTNNVDKITTNDINKIKA